MKLATTDGGFRSQTSRDSMKLNGVVVVGGMHTGTRMSVVDGKRQDGQSRLGSEHRTYGPTRVSTGVVHPLKLSLG